MWLCAGVLPRFLSPGRNFEYLSGEDPFLGFTMVQPVITGIQSQVGHKRRRREGGGGRVLGHAPLLLVGGRV
jgi:hypothetical protein